ncbi:uncharacterized protein [Elaeis guineensis]|uniref:Uncharacterized protein LOC105057672 n=1 Tax=Elaeis guineensis var. tenera TaxID=51953 RepID=A0A6I9S7Z9_ELAGV|nr:uncharacterized protein LOC105057672 [Elaeis guineensis]
MARSILALSPAPSSSPWHFNKYPAAATFFPSRPSSSRTRALALAGNLRGGRRRRERELVVRAGPPTTNSLILAFVLPFSLIAGTIFTSIRIADRLDEKYLEELAMNQAILEENEAAAEDDDEDEKEAEVAEKAITAAAAAGVDGDGEILLQKEEEVAAVSRARNRPRRGVNRG